MGAPDDERLAPQQLEGGVGPGDEPLGGGLLVAGGAVDLARKVEVRQRLGFERGGKLRGRAVVVFDRVGGAQDLRVLQAGDGADEGVLDLVREARGDAVDVHLLGMEPLGFEEDLMAPLLREADHLVLDGGAIAGADPLDDAAKEGRLVEIGADDLVGLRRGVGDPAGALFHVEHAVLVAVEGKEVGRLPGDQLRQEGERGWRGVAGLRLAAGEVDGAGVDAARGAGLEAPDLKAEFLQALAQAGRPLPHAAPGGVAQADVQKAAHEGAGGDDDGPRADFEPEIGPHPHGTPVFREDLDDVALV